MTWQIWSVVPVWLAAAAAAVIIGLTSAPETRVTWLGVALAGVVIVTFFIQLAIQRKEGFVVRAMASVTGAIVVLAIASGVFALIAG